LETFLRGCPIPPGHGDIFSATESISAGRFNPPRFAIFDGVRYFDSIYALGMRQSEWSYDHTETVASAPERVVAWWFHADRSEELRERFGLSAAGDVSLERSVVDGVSIRDFHWKSGQGQDHHHHVETTLTDDGPPARVGDRFVVPVSDVLTFRSSSGKNMTMACDGRIEFISLAGGVTEVRVTHQHGLEGGNRIEQWSHRRTERRATIRLFRNTIAECQAGVGQSNAARLPNEL
jgi:hypothetical protein